VFLLCADSAHGAEVITAAGRTELVESIASSNARSRKRRSAPTRASERGWRRAWRRTRVAP